MATMNISLPDQMKEWVEKQVATGRYANASDYMRDLVRGDQENKAAERRAIAEIQALIDEGIASGVSDMTIDDIRREVLEELGVVEDSDAA